MPKINQSIETEVINEDGEIVSKRANRTLSWGDEPRFVKLYLDDIIYMSDMPARYSAVLHELLKHVSYAGDKDGLCIVLIPRIKRNICDALSWKKTASLDNALTVLTKKHILYRIDKGMYRLNPYLFGKGDWQDISRLRLTIDYDDIYGRTFGTEVICNPSGSNDSETAEN